MNPLKCFFEVSYGEFLGFVVRKGEIELDSQSHNEMPPQQNLQQLKGLRGSLAYIKRFIANLSGKCCPFSRFMKKGWTLSRIKHVMKPSTLRNTL